MVLGDHRNADGAGIGAASWSRSSAACDWHTRVAKACAELATCTTVVLGGAAVSPLRAAVALRTAEARITAALSKRCGWERLLSASDRWSHIVLEEVLAGVEMVVGLVSCIWDGRDRGGQCRKHGKSDEGVHLVALVSRCVVCVCGARGGGKSD